jgi:Ser/Thr protein kinase RdoA (MazF antagonist)
VRMSEDSKRGRLAPADFMRGFCETASYCTPDTGPWVIHGDAEELNAVCEALI